MMISSSQTRPALEPVIVPSSSFLRSSKVSNPKGCTLEMDKSLDAMVFVMKGDISSNRVQYPPENRPLSSLRLRHSLATLQLRLNNSDHFAVEFTVSQNVVQRLKLIAGTNIKEPKYDMAGQDIPVAKLPLIIPRNKWVQVVFHVGGIIGNIFGLPALQSIDSVAICGTGRVGMLMTSNSEQACIDSAPVGLALFAVPAYCAPVWATANQTSAVSDSHTATQSNSPRSHRRAPNQGSYSPDDLAINSAGQGYVRGDDLQPSNASSPPPLLPSRLGPISDNGLHGAQTDAGGSSSHAKINSPQLSFPSLGSGAASRASPPARDTGSGDTSGRQQAYIRLVNSDPVGPPSTSLRNRPGEGTTRSTSVPRSYPGGGGAAAGAGDAGTAANLGWWNDVAGWDAGQVEDLELGGHASPKPPPQQAQPNSDKRSTAAPRPGGQKTKGKVNPENERVQRLIAARKWKFGALANGGPRGGGSSSDGTVAGGGGATRCRRHRARRRMQILRANEHQSNLLAVAKNVAPSEVSIDPASLQTVSSGADIVPDQSDCPSEPKYGYGFGYLGILHENGEYEEEDGVDSTLKGAWSLALSDDDNE